MRTVVLLWIFWVNFVIHYWNKNNLFQYVHSIPPLSLLSKVASYLSNNPLLVELNPGLSKSVKIINDLKSRMSFFQLDGRLQGEFEIIGWIIFKISTTMLLLEPLVFILNK